LGALNSPNGKTIFAEDPAKSFGSIFDVFAEISPTFPLNDNICLYLRWKLLIFPNPPMLLILLLLSKSFHLWSALQDLFAPPRDSW